MEFPSTIALSTALIATPKLAETQKTHGSFLSLEQEQAHFNQQSLGVLWRFYKQLRVAQLVVLERVESLAFAVQQSAHGRCLGCRRN